MNRLLLVLFLTMIAAAAASAQQTFVAALTPTQEVPPTASSGKGTCKIVLNAAETQITISCTFSGLTSNANAGHIHGNAAVGSTAGVLFGFSGVTAGTSGTVTSQNFGLSPAQVGDMRRHLLYVNIHTTNFPNGEIRGQIKQTNTVFDRDGDGRTDIVTFRQSTNEWWIRSSLTGASSILVFGSGAGDNWLNNSPGDFDGDGIGDLFHIKLFGNNANWAWSESSTFIIRNYLWGDFSAGVLDQLAYADYDGDGITDVAVFRRSTGDWWIRQSTTATLRWEHFGTTNDFGAIGDYDGDGKADLTAVRVEGSQRIWYTKRSSDGVITRTPWGASTDGFFFFAPVDVDGDGKQDLCVNRTLSGQRNFSVLRSSDGGTVQFSWGDTAAPASVAEFGDYDGDGKTDFVARKSNGTNFVWQILRSSNGAIDYITWGLPTDQFVDYSDGIPPQSTEGVSAK